MRPRHRWLYVIAGLAAALVTVAAVTKAITEGSWEPILAAGWIPAVIAAAWPGSYRRCRITGPRRRTPA